MRKAAILLPGLLSLASCVTSQNFLLFEKKNYVGFNDVMPYRILLPEGYDSLKKYPLIIFLHGSGERGNDNEKQLSHGTDLFLKEENRKKFPAFVVFPQCSEDSYWCNAKRSLDSNDEHTFSFLENGEPTKAMELLQQLIHSLIKEYPVQKEQVYIGGLSMGGMGTFEIVRREPNLFAAAFPICGGAHPATAGKLTKTSWWIFHGEKDNVVPPEFSIKMADQLKKAGAKVKFTLYPNANHNSWDSAFAEPELLSWLFSQRK